MLVWFSVTPIGTGSASVSAEVARALDALEATGVKATTDASGTLVEGEWEECMQAVRAAADAVLEAAPRVSVVCKMDLRTDKPSQSGQDKLTSLEVLRPRGHERADGPTGRAETREER